MGVDEAQPNLGAQRQGDEEPGKLPRLSLRMAGPSVRGGTVERKHQLSSCHRCNPGKAGSASSPRWPARPTPFPRWPAPRLLSDPPLTPNSSFHICAERHIPWEGETTQDYSLGGAPGSTHPRTELGITVTPAGQSVRQDVTSREQISPIDPPTACPLKLSMPVDERWAAMMGIQTHTFRYQERNS